MALRAMKARADELHASGVAVVAYAPGASVASWSSRMQVVGSMTQAPSAKDKGSNLLGIAYAKAAEMAATLRDSGSGVRPPLTGEFGWQGGVVAKGKDRDPHRGLQRRPLRGRREYIEGGTGRAGGLAVAVPWRRARQAADPRRGDGFCWPVTRL